MTVLFNKTVSRKALSCVVLTLIWLAMVYLVNPIGDFPLNDDFAYGRSVRSLVNEGKLNFAGWQDMALVGQVLWGALFCLPFGFSFTALRFSTLVLGLVGVLATYGVLEVEKCNRQFAFIGALLVAINPIYFELSNTFMTDVPFFALAMLAVLFLARSMRSGSLREVLTGLILACFAMFIRQIAIVIPLAFVLACMTRYLREGKISFKALLWGLIPAGAVVIYLLLGRAGFSLPSFFPGKLAIKLTNLLHFSGYAKIISVFLRVGKTFFVYIGLFILPIMILNIGCRWRQYSARRKAWFVFFGVIIYFVFIKIFAGEKPFPFSGNILFDFGLGPPTLRDQYLLKLEHLPVAPMILREALFIAGILGAVILAWNMFTLALSVKKTQEISGQNPAGVFYLFAGALYFLLICFQFFDRTLIFLIPLSMLFLVVFKEDRYLLNNRIITFFAVSILASYAFFTVGSTRDYLSWNRARWEALDYLTKEKRVSHKDIDGGFEFNGWYGYDSSYKSKAGLSWWWVTNDDYIISFGPIPGFREEKRYPYRRWIPLRQDNILILRKTARAVIKP